MASGVLGFGKDIDDYQFNQDIMFSANQLERSSVDDVYDEADIYTIHLYYDIDFPDWWIVSWDDYAADICAEQGYFETVYIITIEKTTTDLWFVRILAVSPLK